MKHLNNNNIEEVPWDPNQPLINISYTLITPLSPYTDYSCNVYPVYIYYDDIIQYFSVRNYFKSMKSSRSN